MTKDEALKLALAFIEAEGWGDSEVVITAIKEASAQPEQEPNIQASIRRTSMGGLVGQVLWIDDKLAEGDYNLYTTPPQRTWERPWVSLTDEEKQEWIDAMPYDPQPRHCMTLVNIIEAKLKEKNT